VNPATTTALIGTASAGGMAAITAMFGRRHGKATVDSLIVESSDTVVRMMRDQLRDMSDRLARLELLLANETAARIAATAVRDAHILLLEQAIIDLHGVVPPHNY